jgi:hypothetical protein
MDDFMKPEFCVSPASGAMLRGLFQVKAVFSGDFRRPNLTLWEILGCVFSGAVDSKRVTGSVLHSFTFSPEIGG